jgi:hypothetical protein
LKSIPRLTIVGTDITNNLDSPLQQPSDVEPSPFGRIESGMESGSDFRGTRSEVAYFRGDSEQGSNFGEIEVGSDGVPIKW